MHPIAHNPMLTIILERIPERTEFRSGLLSTRRNLIKMDIFNDSKDSSDEDDPIVDGDICDRKEINSLFSHSYHVSVEEAVSLKKCYILYSTATKDFDKIAIGTSNKSVQVFDLNNNFTKICTAEHFISNSTISGVRFCNNDPNILYVANSKSILLYDLRTKYIVQTFEDNTGGSSITKNITCFDQNQNDRILCAGTEQIDHESYLLFFDIRKSKLLGAYWEGHTDDITQVLFHRDNPDILSSGAVDGLINIYDTSETTEDNAFKYCFNTECSVQQLNWHKNINKKDLISCITHTNDLYLFDVEKNELLLNFERENITKLIQRKSAIDCNVINCHNMKSNEIFVLAGSNYNKGDCLRSLKFDNKSLIPMTNFEGSRQIIRTSLYNETNDVLLTSGESGIISIWKSGKIDETNDKLILKQKSKISKAKHKPY